VFELQNPREAGTFRAYVAEAAETPSGLGPTGHIIEKTEHVGAGGAGRRQGVSGGGPRQSGKGLQGYDSSSPAASAPGGAEYGDWRRMPTWWAFRAAPFLSKTRLRCGSVLNFADSVMTATSVLWVGNHRGP